MRGYRRNTAVLFAIALAAAGAAAGSAAAQGFSIVTEEFPPYSFIEEGSGKKLGLGTELVQALLDELGLKAEISVLPWARALATAQEGENVLIYSLKRSPDREEKFKWVGEIILSKAQLIALKGSPIPPSAQLADFKAYSVAAVRDGANARQLAADGFQRILLNSDREICWKRLRDGTVELWCTDLASARYIAKKLGDDPALIQPLHLYEALSRDGLYLAFGPKSDDALVERFRRAYAAVKAKGVYDRILDRYLK